MTPRMKELIRRFKEADPAYKPPPKKKAEDSPWTRWINGMSPETFEAFMEEETGFLRRMRLKRMMKYRRFERDLGKTKRVDVGAGTYDVINEEE